MTTKEIIPDRLQKLIDESQYAGGVRDAFENLIPMLGNKNTGLFFFPEYTDHGPDHISGVLATAVKLIPDKSWRLLTPEDGVVLAISALLHDAAMVLTSDGLLYLLTSDNLPRLDNLDNLNWKDLFDEFFAEARRWDGRFLFQLLGDQRTPHSTDDLTKDVVHIQQRLNPENWSVRYRKFLGEFVRRHHGRIAHEIAHFGFPGNKNNALKLQGISDNLFDLAGFVSRSHSLSLRSTYDFLDTKYDGHLVCRGTHPLYLMVLLRIADYIQLDAHRAGVGWLSVQRLRSPISQAEWNAHLAIDEIRPDDNDPESLFISAKPESASTFIRIKKVLAGLQRELDSSWAVLSEVFGRRQDICELEITLRRVRSNLDDVQQFLSKQKPRYYPIHAAFDTAGASLLKLLIRPLYGDRPETGIRELMQNSLDAVRELAWHLELHPELRKIPLPQQKADVLISIDKGKDRHYYLTVSDKGIGMKVETIRDYFLKAGASFRQSDAWQKEFIQNGKSKVLRSGRFGIGALAAFLLGDRIKVSTRHVGSKPEDGIAFEAGIDDDSIELRRETISVVGTIVVIRLYSDAAKHLINDSQSSDWTWPEKHPWDWYVLDDPIVERRLNGEKLSQFIKLPGDSKSLHHNDWHVIHPADYKSVHWGYPTTSYSLWRPKLACNGILVVEQKHSFNEYSWGPRAKQTPFSTPFVSVLDEDVRLPLTLRRDRLETSSFPFAKELAEDIAKDFCSYLLLHLPTSPEHLWKSSKTYPFGNYSEWLPIEEVHPFLATNDGIVLLHPWHIKEEKIKRILFSTFDLTKLSCFQKIMENVSGCARRVTNDGMLRFLRQFGSYTDTEGDVVVGARVLITDPHFFARSDYESLYAWESTFEHYEEAGLSTTLAGKSLLIELGQVSYDRQVIELIYSELSQHFSEPIAVYEVFLDESGVLVHSSPFTKVWSRIMKKAVIPYDPDTRQREFAKAFISLKDYIKLWEAPAEGTWRHTFLSKERLRWKERIVYH